MVSPLSAVRYNRPHPYEERTPRFSPPSAYNSTHYAKTYDNDWRPNGHARTEKDPFHFDVNEYHKRWNEEENYQPADYYNGVPTTSYYHGSMSASRLENQNSFSNQSEYQNLNRYPPYENSNTSVEHNKWSEYSNSRLHEAESSSRYCLVKDQESNFYSGNHNRAKHRSKWQDHLRESRVNNHLNDPGYDHHYDDVRNDHSTDNILDRDSAKNPKQQKYIITCLICSEEVKRRDIQGHLLFGFVECLSCPWSTKNCKDFSERHKNRYQCSHRNLQWSFSTVEQMRKTRNGKTKESLKDYLASTIALKYYAPYDFAYNHLQAIVDEMPDAVCEEISALVDVDFEQSRFANTTPDAEPDSTIYKKGNLEDTCNNSDESTETVIESLAELVTFHQSPEPHVLRDETVIGESDVELLSSRKITSDTAGTSYAKKEYLDSSSNSRMPKKKNKTSKIVSVKDKHRTLIIGSSRDINKSQSAKATQKESSPKGSKNEGCNSKDGDILPSFVGDNYVLTYTLSDDCPQCYVSLNPNNFTLCVKSYILVAKCDECSLFICIRNKVIDSYKSSLEKK